MTYSGYLTVILAAGLLSSVSTASAQDTAQELEISPSPSELTLFERTSAAIVSGVPNEAFTETVSPSRVRDVAELAMDDYETMEYARVRPLSPGQADCNSFVQDVENRAGNDVGPVATFQMATSPEYIAVPDAFAEPGDVILTPPAVPGTSGHMGIYSGDDDGDRPWGFQMGQHGAAEIPWSGEPEFYRPATTPDLEARIADQLSEFVLPDPVGETRGIPAGFPDEAASTDTYTPPLYGGPPRGKVKSPTTSSGSAVGRTPAPRAPSRGCRGCAGRAL